MSSQNSNSQHFGTLPDGRNVALFTIYNANGIKIKLSSYGATLTELHVPDREGTTVDVVLGFDNLEGYLAQHPYFGTTTGRVANRIAGGNFLIEGKTYRLAVNNPPNHLHGGLKGLDKQLWEASPYSEPNRSGVKFHYESQDGEEGYPGKLSTIVDYSLSDSNELRIDYEATTDKPTPVNLTNHSYFNLANGGRTSVLEHLLQINADFFTPVDKSLIPTGEVRAVVGTCMDFTKELPIGSRIQELTGDRGGYDHNYVLNKEKAGGLEFAAKVSDPVSGRILEVFTTEPGLQFYSGNFLDGTLAGKNGTRYCQFHGFCLEAQHFPDAVNQPTFPSIILRPGEIYRQTTVHKFSTMA